MRERLIGGNMNQLDSGTGKSEMSPQLSSAKTFSIVTPALNEENNIGNLIEDVLEQDLGDSLVLEKIIIVSDASTDNTNSIVAEKVALDKRITLIINADRVGNAQSINIGKNEVGSDFLVILDGDIRLDGSDVFINLLLDVEPDVGMVGGNPKPVKDRNTLGAAINQCGAYLRDTLRPRINNGNNIMSALGCIIAMDKRLYQDVVIPLNPVSPELLVPNDQYFYMKCLEKGLRFVSKENARVYFRLSSSIGESIKVGVRYVFSVSSMDSFFDDSLLAREYHIPLNAKAYALAKAFRHMPLMTLMWGVLHLYVLIKVYVMKHILKKGVNAAWEVSETSKDIIDKIDPR
jgi:glycosyltransferase involved in cell wall biosynthesis